MAENAIGNIEITEDGKVQKTIFVSEDTVEGIFTMVYDAWSAHLQDDAIDLRVEGEDNYELFAKYVYVDTDMEKAVKVARSVSRKISTLAFDYIYAAALSYEKDKAMAIYRFLKLGFSVGNKVTDMNVRDEVNRVFQLHRNIGNEAHLFKGFVRFVDMENGLLVAKIKPKNQVLPIIAEHFADRFSGENFVIVDETHGIGLFHALGKQWFLSAIDSEAIEKLWQSERSDEYERLWKTFFKSIEITPRHNEKCQKTLCSLRYRDYMTEFLPK